MLLCLLETRIWDRQVCDMPNPDQGPFSRMLSSVTATKGNTNLRKSMQPRCLSDGANSPTISSPIPHLLSTCNSVAPTNDSLACSRTTENLGCHGFYAALSVCNARPFAEPLYKTYQRSRSRHSNGRMCLSIKTITCPYDIVINHSFVLRGYL